MTRAALLAAAIICLLLAGCGGNHGRGGPAPVGAGLSPAQGRSETGPYVSIHGGGISVDGAAPSMDELKAVLQAEFERLGIDPAKAVAAAPTGQANAVFDLSAQVIDPDGEGGEPPSGIQLSWTEQLTGDYDQNGLVNYSDLTPIGWQWQSQVEYDDPALHGGFEWWPAGDPDDDGKSGSADITSVSAARPGRRGRSQTGPGRVIDPPLRRMPSGSRRSQQLPAEGSGALNWRRGRINGHRDGLIELGDITPIAYHWLEQLSGYVIEHAVNRGDGLLSWEAEPLDLGQGRFPSAPRSLATTGIGLPVRYHVEVPLSEPEYAQVWRVAAYDTESGGRGADGNLASCYPTTTGDTTPPVWADTVGAAAVIPAAEQLTVQFGTATDEQSPPVSYRLYWAEGDAGQPDAPFNYEAASHIDVAAGPHTITGLMNDQYYRAAVRAMDSAEPPNLELNTTVLGATVEPRDVYAPEWQGRTGIADLFYGGGTAIVVFDAALDSYTDGYGTWESGPVIYRVYYGEGQEPDLAAAQYVEYVDCGLSSYVARLEDLDTTATRWFAVRARDQADYPNEDDNTRHLVGRGVSTQWIEAPGLGPGIPAGSEPGDCYLALDAAGSRAAVVRAAYEDDNKLWLSNWDLTGSGFEHRSDVYVTEFDDRVDVYSLLMDAAGKLLMLATVDPAMGSDALLLYSEAAGSGEVYNLGELSRQTCGFDVDGRAWIVASHWNGSVIDPLYNVHFSFWPPVFAEPFWQTWPQGETDNLWPGFQSAIVADGRIALRARAGYGAPAYRYYMMLVDPDGEVGLQLHPPAEEETTLVQAAGRSVAEPLWVEHNDLHDDQEWWSISGEHTTFRIEEQPPVELGVDGWRFNGVLNAESIAVSMHAETASLIDQPGEAWAFHYIEVLSGPEEVKAVIRLVDEEWYHSFPDAYVLTTGEVLVKLLRYSQTDPELREIDVILVLDVEGA